MKNTYVSFFFLLVACVGLSAQDKNLTSDDSDITYEIRYWQNMSNAGSNAVMVDTMVYQGKDRSGFDYSSADCVSYYCKQEDNLIYSVLDKLETEREWTVKDFFIRQLDGTSVPFRTRQRQVYKIYVSDAANRNTGIGNYTLVSKEFGVICRWNADGEFFQLLRIDIVKQDKTIGEVDLLPLFERLYMTDIFSGK